MRCIFCLGVYENPTHQCTCEVCTNSEQNTCIFCCYSVRPAQHRSLVTTKIAGYFLCIVCRRERALHRLCICCSDAFLCTTCCDAANHKCCLKHPHIQFINRGLTFAYPSKGKTGWLNREVSEAILTRTASLKTLDIDLKGFSKNVSRRFAAVELEFLDYEDASELNTVLEKWKCTVVQDNSMVREYQRANPRNERRLKAFEINTSPACGDALLWQLQEIGQALVTSKVEVSLSCGIHVHIDCRDFGYQELQKLIRVYEGVEETLFAAMHWSRYDNEFCLRCGKIFHDRFIEGVKPDTKTLKTKLISGVYGERSLANRGEIYHNTRADHYGRLDVFNRNPMRYAALNLHSYFLRGTVESRVHHASYDYQEVYNWAKILIDLFDAVGRTPHHKIDEILTVKKAEILGAVDLLNLDNSSREINTTQAAKGLVILRSLLPDVSFENLINKIRMACAHPRISVENLLPCQLV